MHDNASSLRPSIDLNKLLDFGAWSLRQKVVVALAALTVFFDGMDIQMIGFAVPAIAKDWGLTKASFAPVLATGLFGVALGTAVGGLVGDRFGRRPALLVNVLLFALATLAVVVTHTVPGILVLRFIAGLGIGGALPNAATLTAEYTPANRRPAAVTLTIVCIPLGGLIAGIVASHTLPAHSWRTLFVVGGAAPLVLLLVLFAFLPESPRFLAKDPRRREQLSQVLRSIGRSLPVDATLTQDGLTASPARVRVSELFGPGLARDTISLWIAFFLCLTSVYLAFNWLPSILAGQGFGLKVASEGLALYNFGGIVGALVFGLWINFKGSRIPMIVGCACAALSGLAAAWLLHLAHPAPVLLFVAITAHGLFVNAVQTTLYALAAHLYATRMRATGVAAALAIGRTGAILSAFLGAVVLGLAGPVYFGLLALGMLGVLFALALLRNHIPGAQKIASV